MHILHVSELAKSGTAPSVHSDEVRNALRQRGHVVTGLDVKLHSRFAPLRLLQSLMAAFQLNRSLNSHPVDLVYCRESWLDPFRGLCLHLRGVPWVIEVNGMMLKDLRQDGARFWLLKLSEWAQGFNLRRATGVFAACRAWGRELKRHYGLERVECLQNGVDLKFFQSVPLGNWRNSLGIAADHIVLGYLGHLGRYYNFAPMLRCLPQLVSEFPHFRLVFVGDGPGALSLKNMVGELGLSDYVRFHPSVSHRDVPGVIHAFDIGWLPVSAARVKETHGVLHAMKLAEYCAAAKPILRVDYVGSDSWESLQDFSWAVEPEGTDTLEVARRALNERARWPKMAQLSGKFAQDYLSWEASVERLETLVKQWMK